MGKKWKQWQTLFSWAPKSLWMMTPAVKLKDTPWKESYDKPRQHIKKQRCPFADQGPYSQSYGFSSSHVWMWELDHKEGWEPKNWCFQIVVLEKTLGQQGDKPVNSKGNQPWIFIGKTVAEAPILWPPDMKSWLIVSWVTIWRPWCWVRLRARGEGMTEDEMVGWHHWLNGHESEQTLADNGGQRAWCVTVCGVIKSWRWLSNLTTITTIQRKMLYSSTSEIPRFL